MDIRRTERGEHAQTVRIRSVRYRGEAGSWCTGSQTALLLVVGLFALVQTLKDIARVPSPLLSARIIPLRPAHIAQALRQRPRLFPSWWSAPLGVAVLSPTRRVCMGCFHALCFLGVCEEVRRSKKASGVLPSASA